MNPFIEQLKKYGPISTEAEKQLEQKIQHFHKKKGEHFLKQGQLISSYFVLQKGIFRAYYIRNGKDINAWFGAENQIFGSILPVYANKPSPENIQLLEDSEIFSLSANELNILYKDYPELHLIGRKIAEEVCILLEERINSLHFESATERYHSLIQQQPYLVNRINLGHIASFLGITQETLSRIRKS